MTNERPALGGMLEQLVELEVIEFCSEPLDAIVERRLKAIWTAQACPNCEGNALSVAAMYSASIVRSSSPRASTVVAGRVTLAYPPVTGSAATIRLGEARPGYGPIRG